MTKWGPMVEFTYRPSSKRSRREIRRRLEMFALDLVQLSPELERAAASERELELGKTLGFCGSVIGGLLAGVDEGLFVKGLDRWEEELPEYELEDDGAEWRQ